MMEHIRRLDARDLRQVSQVTIMHYERSARAYWEGTQNHDVSQNYAALLDDDRRRM